LAASARTCSSGYGEKLPIPKTGKNNLPMIPTDLILPGKKNEIKPFTDEHLIHWFNFSWIFDEKGQKAKDVDTFRTALENFRQEVQDQGQLIMRQKIVDNFNEDGLTYDGQPMINYEKLREVICGDEMKKRHKEHWKIPFTYTMKNIYALEYNVQTWLAPALKKWANGRRTCPVDFVECVYGMNGKSKDHDLVKAAYAGAKSIFKHFHTMEQNTYHMTIRTRSTTLTGYHQVPISFPGQINPNGLRTYLLLHRDTYPGLTGASHEGDISLMNNSWTDYSAFMLASEVVNKKIDEEQAIEKLKEMIKNLKNGTLVRPSTKRKPTTIPQNKQTKRPPQPSDAAVGAQMPSRPDASSLHQMPSRISAAGGASNANRDRQMHSRPHASLLRDDTVGVTAPRCAASTTQTAHVNDGTRIDAAPQPTSTVGTNHDHTTPIPLKNSTDPLEFDMSPMSGLEDFGGFKSLLDGTFGLSPGAN
jgi:hypothetical protein